VNVVPSKSASGQGLWLLPQLHYYHLLFRNNNIFLHKAEETK